MMTTEPRRQSFMSHLEVAKKYVDDPEKQLELHDEMMRCTGQVVRSVIEDLAEKMIEIELSRGAYYELLDAAPTIHRIHLDNEEREHLLLGRIKFILKDDE
jgi:hypothetical protein